ncbi:MAG: hypothetical protein J5685_01190 [Clostridiales bacterium]|nr:hypothetical protein [Clostridiales bacterium]
MKRKKIIATVIAFMLVLSLFSGCDLFDGGNSRSRRSREDDEETERTEEVTEETSEETETSETTDKTEETTVTATETESDPTMSPYIDLPLFGVDVSEQFHMLREFAGEYALTHEDATFGFQKIYGDGECGFGLVISSEEDGIMYFEWDGTDINQADIQYIDESACLDYNDFMALPCPIDTSLVRGEHMMWPSDGTYYGGIVALRLDAGCALVTYGDPFCMSQEEAESLNVGDTVPLPVPMGELTELTVSGFWESDSGHDTVEFEEYLYLEWTGDRYMLYGESDCPVVLESYMAVVPIREDVTTYSNFSLFVDDQDACREFIDTYGNGNAIIGSDYFYSQYVSPQITVYTADGWSEGYGLLFPFTISGGYITDMTISWR